MVSINEEIGLKIRKRRIKVKMTQGELARRVGVSRSSVVNIEHGRHELGVTKLHDVAEALGIMPHRLLP